LGALKILGRIFWIKNMFKALYFMPDLIMGYPIQLTRKNQPSGKLKP